MPVAKEQIRQIISENNLNSVTDVYAPLKDSFKDVLQELMEAELDAFLGYEKTIRGNYRWTTNAMGIPPKTLRASMGNFRLRCLEIGMGSLNQN